MEPGRVHARYSASQLKTLAKATTHGLAWGLRAVTREIHAWRERANAIPDPELRGCAIASLARKRGHTDGAALFAIVAHPRDRELLRLLVAYEIAWDFLDTVNEHSAYAGPTNGRQLHLALIDAIDPHAPISDYYRHHPHGDDDGYLRALVEFCRKRCGKLASYELVRPYLRREATRAQVLGINHDLDQTRRDRTLQAWARSEFPDERRVEWFELTGAASASLTLHALLTVAADPTLTEDEVARVSNAYSPWISAATTMLDSFVDQAEDTVNGDHSYIAHYATPEQAARRVSSLIERGADEARRLPDGANHALIVACMVAMYLSKEDIHNANMTNAKASFIDAGGSLTKVLLPIMRLWRVAYAQRTNQRSPRDKTI